MVGCEGGGGGGKDEPLGAGRGGMVVAKEETGAGETGEYGTNFEPGGGGGAEPKGRVPPRGADETDGF